MSRPSISPRPAPLRWQWRSRRLVGALLAAIALAVIADGFLFERSLAHLLVGHTAALMLCALLAALPNLFRPSVRPGP